MWVVGAVIVGVVVVGVVLGTLVRRRRTNPVDGLFVSQSWIVAQRGNTDTSE